MSNAVTPPTEASRRLRAIGLRPTRARTQILQALLEMAHPVSHLEIQERILAQWGESMDRVTLYRGLDWLVQQGLAHRITADDRVWRFSAVSPERPAHPHFHCLRCGQVICLADSQIPQLEVPQNYLVQEVELVINGLCPHCQSRQKSE
ncbi:MAG: transcriptional repressor [Acidithiobacillus sp.]|nr:transcriptional repressor [Acidithiobacillus sp.]